MVWAFWPETDTRPVIQPEPSLLSLFLWDFKPLPPPNPLYALMIYMPAAVVQHPSNHAISVTPELSRQFNDVRGHPFFIQKTEGHLALSGSVLPQCAAGPAIGYAKGLPHMVNAPATAGGA